MMNGTGSYTFSSHGEWQEERTGSKHGENTADLLYSALTPSPSRSRTRTLDYDEITEIDRGKFQIVDQPSVRIHTTNALYFSHGDAKNLAHPAVTLRDRTNLSEYRKPSRKLCQCPASGKCHFLCVGFVALTTILLSATTIAACLLILFNVVTPPSMMSSTTYESSPSPTLEQSHSCSCADKLENLQDDLERMQQQVTALHTDIEKIPSPNMSAEQSMSAQQRITQLLLQIESANKTLEQINPVAQEPRVPDTSGLTLPAQIDIDLTTGCKTTTISETVFLYKTDLNAIKYFDETSVVTDFTCELEMSVEPSFYGVGVIEVVRGSTSKNISVFQYLSEVEMSCICYYWAPGQSSNTPSGAVCRRVVTRCPYKKQSHTDTYTDTFITT